MFGLPFWSGCVDSTSFDIDSKNDKKLLELCNIFSISFFVFFFFSYVTFLILFIVVMTFFVFKLKLKVFKTIGRKEGMWNNDVWDMLVILKVVDKNK